MKYIVTPYDKESYEVDADQVEVDEHNSNRVTLHKAGKVVAIENNAASVRPK